MTVTKTGLEFEPLHQSISVPLRNRKDIEFEELQRTFYNVGLTEGVGMGY